MTSCARSAKAALRDWQDTIAAARLCNRGQQPATMAALPENSRESPRSSLAACASRAADPDPVAGARPSGLGIGRFAYSLVLPDMRDALGWSYSAAGFMNTINAAGYLAGALVASRLIRRFGLSAAVRWGTLACVVSLALCALSGNFVVLSFARLLAGVGAAVGFVGGGALAATIAQSRPARANFLLSLFYAGPGLGIVSSGLIAPFVLQAFGPGSWWIVWWAMTLLVDRHDHSAVAGADRCRCRHRRHGAGQIRRQAGADLSRRLFPVRRRLHRLHDLHDRLCPRCRRRRGGAERVLVPDRRQRLRDAVGVAPRAGARRGGLSTAIILGVNAIGAALPLFGHSPCCSAISALVFGVSFFAVVGSTTAFVRFNYPPAAWPTAIAAMTIAFGIGQTLGPIAVGADHRAHGQPVLRAQCSARRCWRSGAIASAFQKKLGRPASPRARRLSIREWLSQFSSR